MPCPCAPFDGGGVQPVDVQLFAHFFQVLVALALEQVAEREAVRRAAIVDAAIKLFSQNGFRGTTTKQLAQAVGVSEPVLYMHFATKSELYSAIIENLAERGEQLRCSANCAGAEGLDDLGFFRQLAQLLMSWHQEDPSRIRLLLYSALDGHELSEYSHALRRQVDLRMQRQDARGGQRGADRRPGRNLEAQQGLALRQRVDHFDGDGGGAQTG